MKEEGESKKWWGGVLVQLAAGKHPLFMETQLCTALVTKWCTSGCDTQHLIAVMITVILCVCVCRGYDGRVWYLAELA